MLFFCKTSFSQSYQDYIDTAYQKYLDKEFNQSFNYYQKAFKVKTGNATDYYNAGCVASLTKQLALSIHFLKEAFKDGYDNLNFLNKDTDLTFLREQPTWNEISSGLKSIMDSVELNYDKPLKDSLAKILADDQLYRNRYAALFKSSITDSTEINNLRDKILHIDSVNEDKVVQILDKYGWLFDYIKISRDETEEEFNERINSIEKKKLEHREEYEKAKNEYFRLKYQYFYDEN